MTKSSDAGKAFGRNQHPFLIKPHRNKDIQELLPSDNKHLPKQTNKQNIIANIIFKIVHQ